MRASTPTSHTYFETLGALRRKRRGGSPRSGARRNTVPRPAAASARELLPPAASLRGKRGRERFPGGGQAGTEQRDTRHGHRASRTPRCRARAQRRPRSARSYREGRRAMPGRAGCRGPESKHGPRPAGPSGQNQGRIAAALADPSTDGRGRETPLPLYLRRTVPLAEEGAAAAASGGPTEGSTAAGE